MDDRNMSGLNGFERTIKDALEPYEVPYNSADWSQLERALNGRAEGAHVSRSGLFALLLGGSMAAFTSIYLLVTPGPEAGSKANGMGSTGSTRTVENTTASITHLPQVEIPAAPVIIPVEPPVTTMKVVAAGGGTSPASSPARAVRPETTQNPMRGDVPAHPMSREPHVKPSVTEGCPGTVIDFAAENLSEEGMYLWNFGDGSFSNKPTPKHVFAKSGSFEVMLSHSTPGAGSIRNKAAADRIIIHEAPEADFNILRQEYENTVPSVHFENRSLGGQSYSWDFGDGTTSTVAHPDHVYKKAGAHTVTLLVRNANGCEDRMEQVIRIDSDYNLMATRSFSPNGDGVDDLFIPEALKTLGAKFHLSIFESKTGALVYETNDPQRPWNGRLNNRGEASATGDYVWMVEMKDGDKLGGTYNGSIQLVR